jgi:Fungal Zn(2)-Cys(6) binuclear cluster domain
MGRPGRGTEATWPTPRKYLSHASNLSAPFSTPSHHLHTAMHWTNDDSSSTASASPPPSSLPSLPSSESPATGPATTAPPDASKKKITRTRTGCQTCRDRKVKCGEEKPQCNNCLRTNHVCPGYAPATVFHARRASRQLQRESSSPADPEGTRTPPPELTPSDKTKDFRIQRDNRPTRAPNSKHNNAHPAHQL